MGTNRAEIVGYRELSEHDLEKVNLIKQIGVELEQLVQSLRADPNYDQRWLAIGATDLQTGLMALTRAIGRPTTF